MREPRELFPAPRPRSSRSILFMRELTSTPRSLVQVRGDVHETLQGTMTPVSKVLKDAKVSKSSVDEIVLVGGSTFRDSEDVEGFFNGKEPPNPSTPLRLRTELPQSAILDGTWCSCEARISITSSLQHTSLSEVDNNFNSVSYSSYSRHNNSNTISIISL